LLCEPQGLGPTLGRHLQGLPDRDPAGTLRFVGAMEDRGQVHDAMQIWAVVGAHPVRPQGHRDAAGPHGRDGGEAGAQLQITAGVMDDHGLGVGQSPDVVLVNPDRMGTGQPRA